VLEPAEAVGHDRIAAYVARYHKEAWKCGRCGFSNVCAQALMQPGRNR
jgi:hypothetical protein